MTRRVDSSAGLKSVNKACAAINTHLSVACLISADEQSVDLNDVISCIRNRSNHYSDFSVTFEPIRASYV